MKHSMDGLDGEKGDFTEGLSESIGNIEEKLQISISGAIESGMIREHEVELVNNILENTTLKQDFLNKGVSYIQGLSNSLGFPISSERLLSGVSESPDYNTDVNNYSHALKREFEQAKEHLEQTSMVRSQVYTEINYICEKKDYTSDMILIFEDFKGILNQFFEDIYHYRYLFQEKTSNKLNAYPSFIVDASVMESEMYFHDILSEIFNDSSISDKTKGGLVDMVGGMLSYKYYLNILASLETNNELSLETNEGIKEVEDLEESYDRTLFLSYLNVYCRKQNSNKGSLSKDVINDLLNNYRYKNIKRHKLDNFLSSDIYRYFSDTLGNKFKNIHEILLSKPELFLSIEDISSSSPLISYFSGSISEEKSKLITSFLSSGNGGYKKYLSEGDLVYIFENNFELYSYIGEKGFIDFLRGLDIPIELGKLDILFTAFKGRITSMDQIQYLLDNPSNYENIINNQKKLDNFLNDVRYVYKSASEYNGLHEDIKNLSIIQDIDDFSNSLQSISRKFNLPEVVLRVENILKGKVYNEMYIEIIDTVNQKFEGKSFKEIRKKIFEFVFSFESKKDINEAYKIIKHDNFQISKDIAIERIGNYLGAILKRKAFVLYSLEQGKHKLTELFQSFSTNNDKEFIQSKLFTSDGILSEYSELLFEYTTDFELLELIQKTSQLLGNQQEEFIVDLITRAEEGEDYDLEKLAGIYRTVEFFNKYNIAPDISSILSCNYTLYESKEEDREESIGYCWRKFKYITMNDIKNSGEFKDIVQAFLTNGDNSIIDEYIENIQLNELPANEYDTHILTLLSTDNKEEIINFSRRLSEFIDDISNNFSSKFLSSSKNSDAGKGSGHYSKLIKSYLLAPLKKRSGEDDIDYVLRIKSPDFNIAEKKDVGSRMESLLHALDSVNLHDSHLFNFLSNIPNILDNLELYDTKKNADLAYIKEVYIELISLGLDKYFPELKKEA